MDLFIALVYAAGSVVCHQLPERSFFLDGQQLPICARCTGLYLSGAAGFIGWAAIKVTRGWRGWQIRPRIALAIVAASAVPTVLSVASGMLGLWDGSNATRALLAIPFGLAAGAVVAAVATKDLR
jgi:uncharacterized membrane protein